MLKRFPRHLLTLALLAALVLTASVGGTQTAVASGDDGIARAIAAQERHTDNLLAKSGVVGTAVGLGGNGRAVVFVLTERAGVRGIPGKLDGVLVIPQVTGKIVALAGGPPPKARFTASCTDLTCDFDGTGSSDRKGGTIEKYDWDFGDGTTAPDAGRRAHC